MAELKHNIYYCRRFSSWRRYACGIYTDRHSLMVDSVSDVGSHFVTSLVPESSEISSKQSTLSHVVILKGMMIIGLFCAKRRGLP